LKHLGRTAILGSLTTAMGSMGGFVGRFIANAILARLLLPVDFGDFVLAMIFAELVGMIAAFSFSQALIQLEDRYEKLVGTVLWMDLGVATCIFLVSLGLWPLVASLHSPIVGQCFIAMSAGRVLGSFGNTLMAAQHRRFRYHRVALLKFLSVAFASALAVVLALLVPSPLVLAVRDAGPRVFITLVLGATTLLREPRRFREFDRRAAAAVWGLGKALFLHRSLQVLQARVDQLVIGLILGNEKLGLFQQARYLSGLPPALVEPVAGVVGLRTLSALHAEPAKQARAFALTQFAVTRVIVLFVVGAGVAGDLAVRVILGAQWSETGELLMLLAPWIVLFTIASNYLVMLTAVRRFTPIYIATAATAFTLATTSVPLGLLLDVEGVVLANYLAVVTYLVVLTRATPDHLRVDKLVYLPALLAGALAVGVGLALRLGLDLGGLAWAPRAALALAAAMVTYGLTLWLAEGPRLRAEVRYVRDVLRRRRATTTEPPDGGPP